ncbi:helix-turn-helix transcriptional regulator [Paenibacillus hodogayensis]|uniref:Helix-turn-helix transcriptional regulator n=1 Tax=Paenibacillus hodogayensis TaxID=279208 RepID=A0ABV5VYJ5_9BACL
MNPTPLSGQVPYLLYFMHWKRLDKFVNYEDSHPSWLIFAVENGSFYYKIGTHEGNASFGDIIVCPPGETFRRVVNSPVSLFVMFVEWRDCAGNPIKLTEAESPPTGKINIRDVSRLASNFRSMSLMGNRHDPWTRWQLNHYAANIWLLLCEELQENPLHAADLTNSPLDPIAEEASMLIQKQAFQDLRLLDIAEALQTSLSQLSKRFKKTFRITPIQYLTQLRLEKAKSLLLETDLTLDQISECCGYQNGFYLNRVFKKHEHVTPMQFRRNRV